MSTIEILDNLMLRREQNWAVHETFSEGQRGWSKTLRTERKLAKKTVKTLKKIV